ncbi:MAG: SNF2-related protein, partial [Mycoplasma sp.]
LLNINELTRQNGETYYKSNLVSSLKWDLTGEIHKVTAVCNSFFCSLEVTKDKIFSNSCQCIIGKNGVVCKHIVSLIYAYIDQIKLQHTEKKEFLSQYTNDSDVLKVISELANVEKDKLFKLKISNLFFDIETIDQSVVNKLLEKYEDVMKVLDSLYRDVNLPIETQCEFDRYKDLYNWIYTFNKIIQLKSEVELFSITTIDEILENNNNLMIVEINNEKFNLDIVNNANKLVDVYATKTSLGYIISSNIRNGIYFSLNDDIYYFLIFIDHLEWFKTHWNNIDNPNQIFRINSNTKSEANFNSKLSDIRSNGLFVANIHGQGIKLDVKAKIMFGYDFSLQKCYLKIDADNDKDIMKKYFSKYVDIYDNENKQFLISTHTDIANVLQRLSLIKNDKNFDIIISSSFKNKKRTRISYRFEKHSNWLNLSISGEFDPSTLQQIFNAYNAGQKYFSVNEQVYDLEESGLDELKNILKNINYKDNDLSINMNLNQKDMFYLNSKMKNTELQNYVNDFTETIIKHKYIDEKFIPGIKPFQVYGVNWLISILEISNGCILADEMGLGKTLQTIALLKYQYINQKNTLPTLVILPLSLVDNWIEEFKKFFPEQKVVKISGKSNERKEIIDAIEDNTVYITTYNLIKNDIDLIRDTEFLNVILDEGQYIKNFTSLWTKHIKNINSKNKLILSGTPVENNLLELWSIFDFILPGYLGELKQFRNLYTGKKVDDTSLFELSLKIKPFILQRKKIDHLDLPSKNHTNLIIKMTDNERNIYNNLLLNVQEKLVISVNDKGEIVKNQIEILSLITKLRQFCCSPDLIGISNHDDTKMKNLLQLITGILEKDENAKIVVFSNFASVLHIIKETLMINGFESLIMTGENTAIQRSKTIEQFKTDLSSRILLLSLKSGGVGLNLTVANNVIHYNPWWNESAELQATDRLHRIGQENQVNVYRLLYENSIESDIQNLKEMKTDIINKTINHSNYNELLKILKDKKTDNENN